MNREEMGSRATTQAGPVARTSCAVVGSSTSFVLGDLRAGPERNARAVPPPSIPLTRPILLVGSGPFTSAMRSAVPQGGA